VAVSCPYCRSFDIGAGFDGYQCFACGGHMKMDGSKTVPTSALDPPGATYDGPGKEMIEDPENPPFPAKEARR
jgi:tRNA(Ile2) C34 agmatinyltransferase TiaS